MKIYPLLKEEVKIIENYKGYDVTMIASIDETGKVYEHFRVWDSEEDGEAIYGFDTLQKCIDWINI